MRETNIFKVLADSQRRAILMMLRNERLNAGEIAEKITDHTGCSFLSFKIIKKTQI
mgnify:CR=1 FL=1